MYSGGMGKTATVVKLSGEDRAVLEGWVRASTTEQRLVQRGRIVLAAADGTPTQHIARLYRVRPATVSQWRTRFATRRASATTVAASQGAVVPYRLARSSKIVESRRPACP